MDKVSSVCYAWCQRQFTIPGSIINAYYAVVSGPTGATVDASRDCFLHHPNTWVSIAGKDSNDAPTVTVMTLTGYHSEILPRSQGFYKKEVGRVVSRSGNMAHV